jgi:CheY-like chemotaxis protein
MSTPHPGKRILLVEDNSLLRDSVTKLLERAGFAVTAAAHGEEALSRLQDSEKPALILLDLSMPVMDGWQFRRVQAKDARLASIPVVLFSGEEDLTKQAAALQSAAILEKPVEPEKLLRTVRRLCA